MSITLCVYTCYLFGFMRRMKNVVNEIWLDNSGKEIKISYKNMRYRKFRDQAFEDILLVNSMITPNVQDKIKLKGKLFFKLGALFPNVFPFNEQTIYDRDFFWTKYYLSNRNFLLLPKRDIIYLIILEQFTVIMKF